MINFAGLRRSGNHAVIDWILEHCDSYTHYNNVVLENNIFKADSVNGNGEFKLASFEDYPLNYLPKGKTILLLRDPLNTFASRLQHLRNSLSNIELYKDWREFGNFYSRLNMISKGAFDLWKQYARAFVENEYICINYNKWFASKSYRKEISKKLNLKHTDKGFFSKKGHQFSGGSSFKNFNPLQSYKNFAEDIEYLSLFDDETIELYQIIFGELPDIDLSYKDNKYIESIVEISMNFCLKNEVPKAKEIIEQSFKIFPHNTRIKHMNGLINFLEE